MEEVGRLVAEHGPWFYALTAAWTFVEGETFVLFAGFIAAQGLLLWPVLLAAAWLGSFSGDQTYFWIGRRYGLRLLARQPGWRRRVDGALDWLKRYDTGFILSFRFIYGLRNFASFAMGISGIPWQRFLGLNFVAAGLWACSFVGAGYFCGHAAERVLGRYAREFSAVLLAAFALALLTFHVLHRRSRRRRREREEAAASPSS